MSPLQAIIDKTGATVAIEWTLQGKHLMANAAAGNASEYIVLSQFIKFRPGEDPVGESFEKQQSIFLQDIDVARRFSRKEQAMREGLGSFAFIPHENLIMELGFAGHPDGESPRSPQNVLWYEDGGFWFEIPTQVDEKQKHNIDEIALVADVHSVYASARGSHYAKSSASITGSRSRLGSMSSTSTTCSTVFDRQVTESSSRVGSKESSTSTTCSTVFDRQVSKSSSATSDTTAGGSEIAFRQISEETDCLASYVGVCIQEEMDSHPAAQETAPDEKSLLVLAQERERVRIQMIQASRSKAGRMRKPSCAEGLCRQS
jgi:hypothetical protein